MSGKINLMYLIRPAAGGMKEHLVSLLKNMDRQKYRIYLACPWDPAFNQEVAHLEVTIVNVDLAGEFKPLADLKASWQMVKYLRQFKIDILHIHSSKAGLVGRLAAIVARTPAVVFTVHNFILYDYMSKTKKKIFATVEALLARCTDQIIAVSRALAKGLVEDEGIPDDKIAAIYNGIDLEPFDAPIHKAKVLEALGLDPQKPVVGTVARLAPQKGIKYLLAAAQIVQAQLPQVQFLIVGDGPLLSELQSQQAKLGLTGVVFAGYLDDIAPVMKALDIFVLPSVTEGLGLTILEAMAAEKPVIATAVGGIPEVVTEETGILVPAADVAELGRALIRLLQDAGLQADMGAQGKQRVREQFSLDYMLTETEKVYEQVLVQNQWRLKVEAEDAF